MQVDRGRRGWCAASVYRVRNSGSSDAKCDVKFDNGGTERRVPLARIRAASQQDKSQSAGAHVGATDVHLIDACGKDTCDTMRAIVEAHAAGRWTRDRHEDFPTIDVPVDQLPGMRALAEAVIASRIAPFMNRTWGVPEDCVQVHDLFVVVYSCEDGGQRALKPHQDESHFS